MEMQSATIGSLAKALAAAQAELSPATKNAQNPHLRNKYADITAVYEAIRAVLPKYGLAVAQTMEPTEKGYVTVRTTLLHESGEWISGVLAMPLPTMGNNPPQQMGSAITYARRYSLSAIVGVVSEDDDDAASCDNKRVVQKARQEAKASNPNPMTEQQLKKLMAMLSQKFNGDRTKYLQEMSSFTQRKLTSCNDLTKDEVNEYLDAHTYITTEGNAETLEAI